MSRPAAVREAAMEPRLWSNRMTFAATLTAPGLARLFVEHQLRAWALPGETVDDARTIVSELVTNAVQFTGFAHPDPTYADLRHLATIAVRVRFQGRSVVLEVRDNGRPSEHPPPLRDEDEHGRGLHIVSCLATAMGHVSHDEGEIVWAELHV